MRPVLGVSVELLALVALPTGYLLVPSGPAQFAYLVAAQLLSTYLIHCPAHYLVGTALGIRFRSMKLGRTTLARALPPRFGRVARMLPIVTLNTDRRSLAETSRSRASAMYLSGTIASSAAAIAVAAAVTGWGSLALTTTCWSVAVVYLAFDIVFSPKSGDVMRARASRGP